MGVHARQLGDDPGTEPGDESVERLVERIKEGDTAAFNELYRRHARQVAGFVFRLLGDDSDLEDIVQDTFALGLAAIHNVRDPGRIHQYLMTIALRQARLRLRYRYRFRELITGLASDGWPRVNKRDPERLTSLQESIAALPKKIRAPWLLHRMEGQRIADAAEICDISLNSAKRRIAEADRRLRRRLR